MLQKMMQNKEKLSIYVIKIMETQLMYPAFLVSFCFLECIAILTQGTAFAADASLENAFTNMFNGVYTLIFGISSAAAAVSIAVAAFLMFFSSDGHMVDTARSWIKRIVVAWLIINCAGAIMNFLSTNITGFSWNTKGSGTT